MHAVEGDIFTQNRVYIDRMGLVIVVLVTNV